MKTYTCLVCETKFTSNKGSKNRIPKYCSLNCFGKRKITDETRKKQSLAKKGKTPHNKLPRVIDKCKNCNKNIVNKKGGYHKKKFCSVECRNEDYKTRNYDYLKGEKSHFWKGGVSTENEKQRKSARYRNWRNKVFERDNYKCVKCGSNGYLHADHIKPFAYYKELRYDINNGRTLCVECHKQTDTYGSKAYLYRN